MDRWGSLLLTIIGAAIMAWIVIIFLMIPFFDAKFGRGENLTQPKTTGPPTAQSDDVVDYTLEREPDGGYRWVHKGVLSICVGRKKGETFKCKPPGFTHEVDGCRCD